MKKHFVVQSKSVFALLLLSALSSAAQAQRFWDTVQIGQNGWLFSGAEQGLWMDEKPADIQAALDTIVMVDRLLKKQNTQLVLALLPAKTRVYADQLPAGLAVPETVKNRYPNALESLQKQGVKVVNLDAVFEKASPEVGPLFQKLDHHWNPNGAKVAGQAVAEAIKAEVQDLPEVKYTLRDLPEAPYPTSSLKRGLSADLQKNYPSEAFRSFVADRLTESSLLGDDQPQIALVGSSFSDHTVGWPFDDALKFHLSRDVLNVAKQGQGPYTPVLNYFREASTREAQPRVLIWEFWEAFLINKGQARNNALLRLDLASNILGKCANGTGLTGTLSTDQSHWVLPVDGTRLNQYLHTELNTSGSNGVRLEIRSAQGIQRTVAIPTSPSQKTVMLDVPVYPMAGQQVSEIRIYAGQGTQSSLQDTQVCTLPEEAMQTLKPVDLKSWDAIKNDIHPEIAASGLDDLEKSGNRWGLGNATTFSFLLEQPAEATLNLSFLNKIADQGLTIELNGQVVKQVNPVLKDQLMQMSLSVSLGAGMNVLRLLPLDHNHGKTAFVPSEPRQLSLSFTRLGLVPVTPLDLKETNLIQTPSPTTMVISGWSTIEGGARRWALGPESTLTFSLNQAADLTLDATIYTPISDQSMGIAVNGQLLDTVQWSTAGQKNVRVKLPLKQGKNVVTFQYARWNGNPTSFAAADSRPMAVLFSAVVLRDGSVQ